MTSLNSKHLGMRSSNLSHNLLSYPDFFLCSQCESIFVPVWDVIQRFLVFKRVLFEPMVLKLSAHWHSALKVKNLNNSQRLILQRSSRFVWLSVRDDRDLVFFPVVVWIHAFYDVSDSGRFDVESKIRWKSDFHTRELFTCFMGLKPASENELWIPHQLQLSTTFSCFRSSEAKYVFALHTAMQQTSAFSSLNGKNMCKTPPIL